MSYSANNPRVLVVTPEVTHLPRGMGVNSDKLYARYGDLADISTALIRALFHHGADVHVALPDYRALFKGHKPPFTGKELKAARMCLPETRIHLAQDRAFYYVDCVYSQDEFTNIKRSLAFQREVINHIVPLVQPDLIHCHGWMTGLIPAMARQIGIPCLFTVHDLHTAKCHLTEIEDIGIDDALFWQNLYFDYFPASYENTRDTNPVDFLMSGIFAAHFVNAMSPAFLNEIITGQNDAVKHTVKQELANKVAEGCADGILNVPDPSYNPSTDEALSCKYSARSHLLGKKLNKESLQNFFELIPDSQTPLFFWPLPLDPARKECRLLADILAKVVSHYRNQNLQIVIVADGPFHTHLRKIIQTCRLSDHVALCPFNERLARLAYGASNFVLVPTSNEPCGLPQMIGPIYGTFPVTHDSGGVKDSVEQLDTNSQTGNGFLFKELNPSGLCKAIEEAMQFHLLPIIEKERQISRVMDESLSSFNYQVAAKQYIALYEKMLKRPLVFHEPMRAAS